MKANFIKSTRTLSLSMILLLFIINNLMAQVTLTEQDNGVSKFDGTNWTTYLAGSNIVSIAIDAEGNKWFGGDGLCKLEE